MNSVCNVEYNIALIINTKETDIDRRRIYPGETWIDRVPTPPLSVEKTDIDSRRIYPGERRIDRVPTPPLSEFDCNIPTTKMTKNGSN